MEWTQKRTFYPTENTNWVMWGEKMALYKIHQKSTSHPMQEMSEHIRQWIFSYRKHYPSLLIKKDSNVR